MVALVCVLRCKITVDVQFGAANQVTTLAHQPFEEQCQILPIGEQRVFRQTFFQPQGIHKGIYHRVSQGGDSGVAILGMVRCT